MSPYPPISNRLHKQLHAIEPSRDRWMEYKPCAVVRKDGERVYVADYAPYIRMWGVTPEEDQGKKCVAIQDVVKIEESPFRLPARFANQIYKAGESGMGYCIFTVQFDDGSSQASNACSSPLGCGRSAR